eukprot:SAG25_NODE_2944_length_1304_cov_2.553527_2_plen_120_part_00
MDVNLAPWLPTTQPEAVVEEREAEDDDLPLLLEPLPVVHGRRRELRPPSAASRFLTDSTISRTPGDGSLLLGLAAGAWPAPPTAACRRSRFLTSATISATRGEEPRGVAPCAPAVKAAT